VKSTVGPGDEVGPAASHTGAPDPACRSVKSTVGPGDEVGSAALNTGAILITLPRFDNRYLGTLEWTHGL
jgi:hypothetical protein